MLTLEERISRLEGAYKQRATKADVYLVKADLQEFKAEVLREMNSRCNQLLYVMLGGIGAILLTLILELIFGR